MVLRKHAACPGPQHANIKSMKLMAAIRSDHADPDLPPVFGPLLWYSSTLDCLRSKSGSGLNCQDTLCLLNIKKHLEKVLL